MQKLWSNTSYNDWFNNWRSASGNKVLPKKLTNRFSNLKDYFETQALQLQDILNMRLEGFINKNFDISGFSDNTVEYLKRFTYYAIDGLLYNGQTVESQTVSSMTTTTGGRTDATTNFFAISSLDFLSAKAIDAWKTSGIDFIYFKWKQDGGDEIPILDLAKFYTKNEVDQIISMLNMSINLELENLDNKKADTSQLITTETESIKKIISNLNIHGDLVSTTVINNDDGSVNIDHNISASAVTDALVIDDFATTVTEPHQQQAPSYNITKKLNDKFKSFNLNEEKNMMSISSTLIPNEIYYENTPVFIEGKYYIKDIFVGTNKISWDLNANTAIPIFVSQSGDGKVCHLIVEFEIFAVPAMNNFIYKNMKSILPALQIGDGNISLTTDYFSISNAKESAWFYFEYQYERGGEVSIAMLNLKSKTDGIKDLVVTNSVWKLREIDFVPWNNESKIKLEKLHNFITHTPKSKLYSDLKSKEDLRQAILNLEFKINSSKNNSEIKDMQNELKQLRQFENYFYNEFPHLKSNVSKFGGKNNEENN
ncbi:hypothetical protein [Spiroplasma endosymbiont of Labia minor]|uniref:hypothetical protein n=1 Tax=Spiroplasma endosymbiont of Labia minor TaxID=3066305 RepID=UPI0030D360ED